MLYCINPLCDNRENPDSRTQSTCLSCGNELLINNRIYLTKPLRDLKKDPFSYTTEIFEVTDLGTKWDPGPRKRIMKILKWSEPKLVELFERESKTLRLLNHPSIPKSTIDDFFTFTPITPAGTSITLRCLVMDKFEGLNLYEYIRVNGKLTSKLALDWLEQLVKILDRVHQSEFFHRDIKPSNIICQPNGKLALIDFGASRQITDTYMTKIKVNGGASDTFIDTSKYEITVVSTPNYTPIEQFNGRAIPQSDFYALGRTFVYLLTATPLNNLPIDKTTGQIIWRDKAPQIDKLFANLIDELQSELVSKRPQTTEVILERLNRLPLKSKIYRVVKSKAFKIGASILSFLTIFAVYYGLKPILANYFFEQGKKAETENKFIKSKQNFNLAISFNQNINKSISSFYFEKAFRNSSKPEIARKYYELAIKFNKNDIAVYSNLALVCQQLADFKCVNDSYSRALKLNSNDWIIHYNLGSFYDDQEQYDKAAHYYKIALKKSKNNSVRAINSLSRLNNLTGNYKNAESLALQGLDKLALQGLNKPDHKHIQATLKKNLAWALFGQKKYLQAQTHLQKSLEIDPQKTEAYCLLAQTQEQLNLALDAKLSWEACLILNSSLPEVQGWRQKILRKIL